MTKLNFYRPDRIKPRGWLKKQLKVQMEGLSGNLDLVWKDVRDSKWIGGDAEGWERFPYWLDGYLPLCYLLDDKKNIEKCKKYVYSVVSFQKEDGWICPFEKSDGSEYVTWAVHLITKVLAVYYQCSGDENILPVIYKALKNYHGLLMSEDIRFSGWGQSRWFECFIAINLIYEKYPEPWLLELARYLKKNGLDYSQKIEQWKRPLNKWTYITHIVNLTMMLKYEAVSYEILGEEYTDIAEKLHQILDKYNGTAYGSYTGDECLSGVSPIQGTELCAIVEQMYSLELLYSHTGDAKWLERLEVLAFNALPATISDDMWCHQYVQMSNQINCKPFPGKSVFRTNGSEAHIFGLEPNFGCCTANFHQGWPKFAMSSFMHNGNTVVNTVPIPAKLEGDGFDIELETRYPFGNGFKYTVNSEKEFNFRIRIPSFARNIILNGEAVENTGYIDMKIEKGIVEIDLSYDVAVMFEERPYGLNIVKSGSLVFSIPIKYEKKMREYERDGVERKYPYCDYHYIGITPWNYGYCKESPLTLIENEIDDMPFSSEKPPVTVKVKARKVEWDYEDGYDSVCAKLPNCLDKNKEPGEVGDVEEITLYPYGCAKLRMTELPLV